MERTSLCCNSVRANSLKLNSSIGSKPQRHPRSRLYLQAPPTNFSKSYFPVSLRLPQMDSEPVREPLFGQDVSRSGWRCNQRHMQIASWVRSYTPTLFRQSTSQARMTG